MSLPNQSGHDGRGALDPATEDVFGFLEQEPAPSMEFDADRRLSLICMLGLWANLPANDTQGYLHAFQGQMRILNATLPETVPDIVFAKYRAKIQSLYSTYFAKVTNFFANILDKMPDEPGARVSIALLFSTLDGSASPIIRETLINNPSLMLRQKGENMIERLCRAIPNMGNRIVLPSGGTTNMLYPNTPRRITVWMRSKGLFRWENFRMELLSEGSATAYHITMSFSTPHFFRFSSLTDLTQYLFDSLRKNQALLQAEIPLTFDRVCEMPCMTRPFSHAEDMLKLRALGMVFIPHSYTSNYPTNVKDMKSWIRDLWDLLIIQKPYRDILCQLRDDTTLAAVSNTFSDQYQLNLSSLPPYDKIVWFDAGMQRAFCKEILQPSAGPVTYEGKPSGQIIESCIPDTRLGASSFIYNDDIPTFGLEQLVSTASPPRFAQKQMEDDDTFRLIIEAYSVPVNKVVSSLQSQYNYKRMSNHARLRVLKELVNLEGVIDSSKNSLLLILTTDQKVGIKGKQTLPPTKDTRLSQLNSSTLKLMSMIVPVVKALYGWDMADGSLARDDEDDKILGSVPQSWYILGAEREPIISIIRRATEALGAETQITYLGYSAQRRGDVDESVMHIRPGVVISDIEAPAFNEASTLTAEEQYLAMMEVTKRRITHWATKSAVCIWKISYATARLLNDIIDSVKEVCPYAYTTLLTPSWSRITSVEVYLLIVPRPRNELIIDDSYFQRDPLYFGAGIPANRASRELYIGVRSLSETLRYSPFDYMRGASLETFRHGDGKIAVADLPRVMAGSTSLPDLEQVVSTALMISRNVHVGCLNAGPRARFSVIFTATPDEVRVGLRSDGTRKSLSKGVIPVPKAFSNSLIVVNPLPWISTSALFNAASRITAVSQCLNMARQWDAVASGALKVTDLHAFSIGGRDMTDLPAVAGFKRVTLIDPETPNAAVAQAYNVEVRRERFDFENPQFENNSIVLANAVIIAPVTDGTGRLVAPTRRSIINKLTGFINGIRNMPEGSNVVGAISFYYASTFSASTLFLPIKGYKLVKRDDDTKGVFLPYVSFGGDYDPVPALTPAEVGPLINNTTIIQRGVTKVGIVNALINSGTRLLPTCRAEIEFMTGYWAIVIVRSD